MRCFSVILKIITLSFFILGSAFSYETEKKANLNGKTITLKNEKVCQMNFVKEMFNQQRIFSSVNIDAKQRRIAERKIEAARNKFTDTGSFCEAHNEILIFEPESLKRQPGDAQFKALQ